MERRVVIHVVDALAATAGPLIARAILETLARAGRCRVALAGGSTPGTTFDWLARHLPAEVYPKLWVTWVDERVLPVGHADRNDTLAARWLDHAPGAHVLPIVEVDGYVRAFTRDFGGLDVVLLGVGPDGHVASLFPGHAALRSQAVAVAVHDSPKPPAERITLTLPVLREAAFVVLLARGANKADVLRRAYAGDSRLPLGCVRVDHWVVDRAAGEGLR